jgi:endonuclease G
VALRDNRIVDVFDNFLHYEADTQPGSSGSPVFNDQWELVALHHASVPAPEHPELGKFVNEGIRVSRLLAFIGEQNFTAGQRALVSGLLASGPGAPAAASPAGTSPDAAPPAPASPVRASPVPASLAGSAGPLANGPGREQSPASPASVTVPLVITIGVGDRPPGAASAAGVPRRGRHHRPRLRRPAGI